MLKTCRCPTVSRLWPRTDMALVTVVRRLLKRPRRPLHRQRSCGCACSSSGSEKGRRLLSRPFCAVNEIGWVKIVVGLGNPGSKYHDTRHNIGFWFIDRLARQQGIALDRHQCDALTGQGKINESPLLLAKPQTFMNRSGVAVAALLQSHGARQRFSGCLR